MKHLFKIMLAVVVAASLTNCKIKDSASIQAEQHSYTVAAEGGELTIPVNSTGIDNVNVDYREDYYKWEVDSATGDLYPTTGWLTIKQVIHHYPTTRDLPLFREGIVVEFAPNNSGVEREATISIRSFNVSDNIKITQPSLPQSAE